LQPTSYGRIYDIDIPGFVIGTFDPYKGLEQDSVCFLRYNFLQYASFNGVRCSDDFEWFARITIKKTTPPPTGSYIFLNRSGYNDNQSGTGTTPITID